MYVTFPRNEPSKPVKPEFPTLNVASWTITLRIAPRQARRQVIPVAGKNYRLDLADGRHLATAWVFPSA